MTDDCPALATALDRLYDTVSERDRHRPEGSYTAHLLADGDPLQKVGEETTEFAIAATERDRSAVVAEAADLYYHLLVALVANDLGPGDLAATDDREGEGFSAVLRPAREPDGPKGHREPVERTGEAATAVLLSAARGEDPARPALDLLGASLDALVAAGADPSALAAELSDRAQ